MIKLKQIMPIENPSMYKIHVAKRSNDGYEPLDEYINGWDNWIGWNTYRGDGKPNRFTRKYVISFMHFYPQYGTFLFGGIFEILKTYSDRYEMRLCDMYKDFIGRLKVKNINTKRGSAFNFENHYETIEVVELLDKPYSSHVFPGYEWVNCPFSVMKNIIDKQTPDWKTALSKIKGVYMLTDITCGKRYIGSAYGDGGVWSRWSEYCYSGHGYNTGLVDLVKEKGNDYIIQNFRFTLLEIFSMVTTDEYIIGRENYWKTVMLSDNKKFGYNCN